MQNLRLLRAIEGLKTFPPSYEYLAHADIPPNAAMKKITFLSEHLIDILRVLVDGNQIALIKLFRKKNPYESVLDVLRQFARRFNDRLPRWMTANSFVWNEPINLQTPSLQAIQRQAEAFREIILILIQEAQNTYYSAKYLKENFEISGDSLRQAVHRKAIHPQKGRNRYPINEVRRAFPDHFPNS
jgi:hypothetical protein